MGCLIYVEEMSRTNAGSAGASATPGNSHVVEKPANICILMYTIYYCFLV